MKKKLICTISILVLAAALCSGCSTAPFKITDSFASYYAKNKEEVGSDLKGMASDLAVLSDSEATAPFSVRLISCFNVISSSIFPCSNVNLTENGAVISTLTKGDTVTVGQVFHTKIGRAHV